MRTLDPGTMGDDIGWSFRIIMLLVTTYGIVMLSTFIGLISNGILSKIQQLRKGRSKVLENGHILILGWSAKIHTIVSELVIANENQKKPVIVILADKDKVEMEDEIKEKIKSTINTKIICRSGDPIAVNETLHKSHHEYQCPNSNHYGSDHHKATASVTPNISP